jgi:hypothetical protein
MNVNFKPSTNQGKSLRFLKSNDGKKTLLKPVIIPPQFWQVTITGPDRIEDGSPIGFTSAKSQAEVDGDTIQYYRHLGCGTCFRMYYSFSLNKFVLVNGYNSYTKDFSTNITTDNWLRVSDNVLVNLTGSNGTVSILPPS